MSELTPTTVMSMNIFTFSSPKLFCVVTHWLYPKEAYDCLSLETRMSSKHPFWENITVLRWPSLYMLFLYPRGLNPWRKPLGQREDSTKLLGTSFLLSFLMLSFSENLNWSELSCKAKFFCRQWFFPHFVCLLKLFNKITFGMLVTKFSRPIKTIKEKVLSLIDTATQLRNFIPKESDNCPADVLLRDLLWIGKLLSHMKCFYTETSRWSGKLLLL